MIDTVIGVVYWGIAAYVTLALFFVLVGKGDLFSLSDYFVRTGKTEWYEVPPGSPQVGPAQQRSVFPTYTEWED